MVGRLAAVVLFLIGVCTLALGDDSILGSGISGTYKASAPAGYQGVGDVVSGWTAYGGMFAYTAAIAAAGTQHLITVINNDTGETCDFLVASTGYLGNTVSCTNGSNGQSLATWTLVESLSGVTSSGGNLTTGSDDQCNIQNTDNVYDTSNNFLGSITSVVSCIPSAGGAYTITNQANSPPSYSGNVNVTAYTSVLFVYNQTGSGPTGWQQSNASYQPTLSSPYCPFAPTAFACISDGYYGGSAYPGDGLATPGNITPANGKVSLWAVSYRVTPQGGDSTCFVSENSATCATSNNLFGPSSANEAQAQGGSSGAVTATATDGKWHALSAVINGASSNVTVDGSATSGTATGNTTAAPSAFLYTGGANQNVFEAGFLDNVALTSTQATNLCKNAQARIGAGNFGATC